MILGLKLAANLAKVPTAKYNLASIKKRVNRLVSRGLINFFFITVTRKSNYRVRHSNLPTYFWGVGGLFRQNSTCYVPFELKKDHIQIDVKISQP